MASKEDALLYNNRVIQKTYIEVDEKGTKAAAVTAADMNASDVSIKEYKTVYFDRPFVYMLIDCHSNVTFFIGTLLDVSEQ